MAERTQDDRDAGRFKRPRRGLWIIAGMVLGLVILAILYLVPAWRERSVEHRLAAIYAAHALPPGENAATIYNRLLAAYLPEQLRASTRGFPTDFNNVSTLHLSDEQRMRAFLEAATRPRCFFPALCDSDGPVAAMKWMRSTTAKRTSMMRLLAWSILRAALDDLKQGRLDTGKEKLHCAVQIAAHLRQQPTSEDFFTARMIEDYLWSALGEFIVERDATNEHLVVIEGILPSLADTWEKESAEMRQVETLLDTRSAWQRLGDLLDGAGIQHAIESGALNYHQIICERRGLRILIELRRYKNQTGRWPDTLDEVAARLSPEALSDPLGPAKLAYELDGGGFHLYSMGRNGRKDASYRDDYPIWPRRGALEWLQERQWEAPQNTGGQNMMRRR